MTYLFLNAYWRKLPAVTSFYVHSVHDVFALLTMKTRCLLPFSDHSLKYHHYFIGRHDLKMYFIPCHQLTKTKNKMKSTFMLWVRQSQNGRRVIAKALSPRLLRNTVPCMEALFISEGLCDYLTISTVGILCWNSVFSASDSWLALTGNQSLPTGDLLFSYQHTKVQTSKSSLLRVTSTF